MKSPKKQPKPVRELSPEEVPAWLAGKIGSKSRKQFAEETGIAYETLWQILSGYAPAGLATQKKLARFGMRGTRKVYLVDAE